MRPATTSLNPGLPAPPPSIPEPVYTRDEHLSRTDWDEVVTRLVGYASRRVRRHGVAAGDYDLQPGDLAQEAIALWLSGKRIFEQGSEHEFFGFFCSVIDSLLSHDREKTIRRGRRQSIGAMAGDQEGSGVIGEGSIAAKLDFERDLILRNAIERFIGSLEADLAPYARLVYEFPDASAEDRARMLGMSIDEIRNFHRRLHRWAKRWLLQ